MERRSGASVRPATSQASRRDGGELPATASVAASRRVAAVDARAAAAHGALGDGRGGLDPVTAAADEDQARHAGGGQRQHGNLAEGVPCPDVHERHVDDVQSAAAFVGQCRELQGHRRRNPGAHGVDRDEDHGDAEGQADDHPHHPVFAAGGSRSSAGQAAHRQDEGHQDDGLHQHLGQGKVRRTLQRKHQCDAVAGDGHHEDGQESLVRLDRSQGPDHDAGARPPAGVGTGVDQVDSLREAVCPPAGWRRGAAQRRR